MNVVSVVPVQPGKVFSPRCFENAYFHRPFSGPSVAQGPSGFHIRKKQNVCGGKAAEQSVRRIGSPTSKLPYLIALGIERLEIARFIFAMTYGHVLAGRKPIKITVQEAHPVPKIVFLPWATYRRIKSRRGVDQPYVRSARQQRLKQHQSPCSFIPCNLVSY
jgi:hypothetical protein